ncbi:HemK2/MTQ2 family protein methyltransferase [Streptomyces sp. NPDC050504]|uniref:HemK2/MTQ2 family protein methyltransferase n=1 Tax=Streptomyces sp. NPDC050504 TaxID=3365618 RepID=UPI0037B943E9
MTIQARTPPQAPARGPSLLFAPPGVYRPQHDTLLLTEALAREDIGAGTTVLDLGTGSGVLALAAARLGARVTAVDITRRAVLTARVNALLDGRRIAVRRGDLTAAVPGQVYDLVISNPPYVPASSALLPRRGAARAWDGGPAGRTVVDRVCDAAPRMLRPHGTLLMVHSGLCGVDATFERLDDLGMTAEVTDRTLVPFGPVLRSRRAWLRRQGMVGDEGLEELVVVRAEFR